MQQGQYRLSQLQFVKHQLHTATGFQLEAVMIYTTT